MLLVATMLVIGSVGLMGCKPFPATAPRPAVGQVVAYRTLTAQEANARLADDATILLVDVRTEAEHRARRIPNSLLLPDYDFERLAPTLLPNKDATIFLYCRSGRRSRDAAMQLLTLGYTDVYDMGGIIDWPYATVTGTP